MITFKKNWLIFFLVFAAAAMFFSRSYIRDAAEAFQKPKLPAPVQYRSTVSEPKTPLTSINLDVPFVPQAPFANWSLPYQEACEEASVLLVDRFLRGKSLSREEADREIKKIVEWEKKRFGYYEHTTAAQTAEILKSYFKYKKVEVKYDATLEDLKKELAAGRPVIVPFAGRLLKNPYYRSPGPVYHMLVVKGFLPDGRLITNDVGTKRGKDFVYDPKVLWNAVHDAPEGGSVWKTKNPEKTILEGRKVFIVVRDA